MSTLRPSLRHAAALRARAPASVDADGIHPRRDGIDEARIAQPLSMAMAGRCQNTASTSGERPKNFSPATSVRPETIPVS